MRNIFFLVVAVAALIFAGKAMAAAPHSHEATSILVESASDIASTTAENSVADQKTADETTMVSTEMEAPVVYDGPVVQSQPQPIHHHQHVYRRAPAKKQNVFEKLMELERKKNAWLKKTFLGR